MTRAWAPNGRDVVDWPAGKGMCLAPYDDDFAERCRAWMDLPEVVERVNAGRATAIANRKARAAKRAAEA